MAGQGYQGAWHARQLRKPGFIQDCQMPTVPSQVARCCQGEVSPGSTSGHLGIISIPRWGDWRSLKTSESTSHAGQLGQNEWTGCAVWYAGLPTCGECMGGEGGHGITEESEAPCLFSRRRAGENSRQTSQGPGQQIVSPNLLPTLWLQVPIQVWVDEDRPGLFPGGASFRSLLLVSWSEFLLVMKICLELEAKAGVN